MEIDFKTRKFLENKKFYIVTLLLCFQQYFVSNIHFNHSWQFYQYALLIFLLSFFLFSVKFSLNALAFASLATLPGLLSFIELPFLSLTLTETYMFLFFIVFFSKGLKIKKNKFNIYLIGLLFACFFSMIGSPMGFLTIGMFIRLSVLIIFLICLISLVKNSNLMEPILFGVFSMPFIALFAYAGQGILKKMFFVNFLLLSRPDYSFQYPIWFAFVIPLMIYLKISKLWIYLYSLFFLFILMLTFARSIILATFITSLLFLIYYRNKKSGSLFFIKSIVVSVCSFGAFIAVYVLSFFDFTLTGSKAGSNEARFEKMSYAWNNFLDFPIFGSGFGSNQATIFAERSGANSVFENIVSPEFGPLTVLTEIGLVGAFFFFTLSFICFKYTKLCISDKTVDSYFKIITLVSFAGFISSFINGNAINNPIVYVLLIIPFFFYDFKKQNSIEKF